jgi:hypothetical protein
MTPEFLRSANMPQYTNGHMKYNFSSITRDWRVFANRSTLVWYRKWGQTDARVVRIHGFALIDVFISVSRD